MSRKRSGLRKSLVLVGILALVVPLLFAFAAPVSAAGTIRVDGDAPGCVGASGQSNPYGVVYCKIQDAVTDASPGDSIHVYPRGGAYGESVNLSTMSPQGELTLATVSGAGIPTPGTVRIHYLGPEAEIRTETAFDGDLTIDGFVVYSDASGIDVEVESPGGADSSLVIRNVTATGTGDNGIVAEADGDVTITNCEANDNVKAGGNGIVVADVGGNVSIVDCEASGNAGTGINVGIPQGAVTISDCTANGNGLSGIHVQAHGHVGISNCTAEGNGAVGFDIEDPGSLAMSACIAWGNEDSGVSIESYPTALQVKGTIICDNGMAGMELHSNVDVDAEGNWWGCAGGPGAPGCETVDQGSGTVDFTPWINRITGGATVDPAVVGEPTVVSFQFHGGPPAVYLGEGPGDLRGPAPFRVSTDNGTLNGKGATVHEFINAANGTLEVTLVPDAAGEVTVTVSGPCGLSDLEGATAVLGVVAAAEFVPEPGTVLLLGSGLMGLAGYAGLRLRKR